MYHPLKIKLLIASLWVNKLVSIFFFFSMQVYTLIRGLTSNPAYFFVGYILIYFMYHSERWWYAMIPTISYSFFFSAIVLAAAVFGSRNKSAAILSIPSLKWLAVLAVYILLVQIWAVLPFKHWFDVQNYLKVIVVLFAAFKLCKSQNDLNLYLIAYVIGAAYIGYYILDVGRNAYGRVEGVGTVDAPDVNDMAAILASAALFCLHFFWRAQKNFNRLLLLIAGFLIVNAIILMNSRGAFLGVFCGAAWYMLCIVRSKVNINYKKLKVSALGILGLVSVSMVVDEQAIDRLFSIKSEASLSTEKQTGSTRVFFWLASLDMVKDYPAGGGSGSFFILSPSYIPQNIDTGSSRNRAVHSIWFQALTEVGILGFIVFILVLGCSAKSLSKMKKLAAIRDDTELYFMSSALQGAFLSFLVAATFLDRFRAVALYMLIMFVAAAYKVNRDGAVTVMKSSQIVKKEFQ